MANKRKKSWFFQFTNVLRADGTTGGIRFRKRDKPTQETFEDLTASTTFSTESDDRAKVYNGNPVEQGDQQGLATLATDAQAKSNQTQLTEQSLVVQPHQLPTAENLDAAAIEDMPTSTMDVSVDGATITRNKYFFRLSVAWLTWLVSRLFKSGGAAGDIPIKNSATDYDWSWGNLAESAGFISSLLANTTFLQGLATNNDFIDFLIANNYFTDELVANTNFTNGLSTNTNFIDGLTNNSTFTTGLATNTVFKENVGTQDSITKDATTKDLKLVGDIESPGNNKYYGTDSRGTKSFHTLSTNIILAYTSPAQVYIINESSTNTCTAVGGSVSAIKIGNLYILNIDIFLTIESFDLVGAFRVQLPVGASNILTQAATTVSTCTTNNFVNDGKILPVRMETGNDLETKEALPSSQGGVTYYIKGTVFGVVNY